MTADGQGSRIVSSQRYFLINSIGLSIIGDRPLNDIIQLGVTPDAGDDDLVLERKAACVLDHDRLKLICTAGFPKDLILCSAVCGYPAESLTLKGRPILVKQLNFQRTCLDFVYRCTCGVCEPRKGCSDKHCNANEHY